MKEVLMCQGPSELFQHEGYLMRRVPVSKSSQHHDENFVLLCSLAYCDSSRQSSIWSLGTVLGYSFLQIFSSSNAFSRWWHWLEWTNGTTFDLFEGRRPIVELFLDLYFWLDLCHHQPLLLTMFASK